MRVKSSGATTSNSSMARCLLAWQHGEGRYDRTCFHVGQPLAVQPRPRMLYCRFRNSPCHARGHRCRSEAATVGAIAALNFALNKALLLIAVAIMGKPGFYRLKQLVFWGLQALRAPHEVGPLRYRIGLILFATPIFLGWVSPYLQDIAPTLSRHSIRAAIFGGTRCCSLALRPGGSFSGQAPMHSFRRHKFLPAGAVSKTGRYSVARRVARAGGWMQDRRWSPNPA